jgi:hypothetical protein
MVLRTPQSGIADGNLNWADEKELARLVSSPFLPRRQEAVESKNVKGLYLAQKPLDQLPLWNLNPSALPFMAVIFTKKNVPSCDFTA